MPRPKRLVSRTVPVGSLDPRDIESAFALFQDTYAGADRTRFVADLAEKQLIILLHDRETGALKGFSTVLVQSRPNGQPGTVIFSGDTVIHRDYWGQKQLQIAFSRILLAHKLRSPSSPLYWFLISKGYRTYLLLANAFPRAVPRCDRADDPSLRAMVDGLAATRFGSQYVQGIVRYTDAHERVREGLAPITARHLDNPHVQFFVDRNPGHADGDELACLAEVRLRDLARIAARITFSLARRSLGQRRAAAAATAPEPQWTPGVRHADGL